MGWIPTANAATRMTYHGLEMPQERIAAFCRRHHIRRLALNTPGFLSRYFRDEILSAAEVQ
jgi:hypothetical protein